MARIGGASGAYVVDLSTGETLYSAAAAVDRLPASVEKLYTTSTALLRLGPTATLTTSVWGVGSLDPTGTWHGILYLKGGGDPTFGSAGFDHSAYGTGATVQRLVSTLVRSLHITAIQGRIVGDGSYFDALRGTPATHFGTDIPDVEGVLSGLAFNRGVREFHRHDPPAASGALRGPAVRRRAAGGRGQRPTRHTCLHRPNADQRHPARGRPVPPVAKLIQLTNAPSDNYLAEMLLKGLGAQFDGAGTTAAGAAVVRQEVFSQFGVSPLLNDGSGLSRADATSPIQVVTLLEKMYGNPDFFNSLAIGGETGTLRHETLGTAAFGVCHGKTGTLHDVANLAGYCQARDGHELAFAFLANRLINPGYVHSVEANRMAAALARYNG